jgi:hypothetical protein
MDAIHLTPLTIKPSPSKSLAFHADQNRNYDKSGDRSITEEVTQAKNYRPQEKLPTGSDTLTKNGLNNIYRENKSETSPSVSDTKSVPKQHWISNLESNEGKEWMRRNGIEEPWFISRKNGVFRPESTEVLETLSNLTLWPNEDPESDRIINQLMYIPKNYYSGETYRRNKKIYLFYGKPSKDIPLGRQLFLRDGCPVNTCELTTDPDDADTADAVFFKVCHVF